MTGIYFYFVITGPRDFSLGRAFKKKKKNQGSGLPMAQRSTLLLRFIASLCFFGAIFGAENEVRNFSYCGGKKKKWVLSGYFVL